MAAALLLSLLLPAALAYPTGAPDAACFDSQPQHPGTDQTPGSGNFQISFPDAVPGTAPNYTSPHPLRFRVQVEEGGAYPWIGHLIGVFSVATGARVGRLVDYDTSESYYTCTSVCSQCALTHRDTTSKTSLDFTWQPPTDGTDVGDVLVRVTLVQSFAEWYVLEEQVTEVAGADPPAVMHSPFVRDAQPSATPDAFDVVVAWDPPASNGSRPIKEFILSQSTNGAAPVVAYRGLARSILLTGVPQMTNLSFTVTADNMWVAADSAPLLVEVPAAGTATNTAPVGLAQAAALPPSMNSISLSWEATSVSPSQVIGYELQVKPASAPSSSFATAYFGQLPSATVAGLIDTTEYSFRVRSQSMAGDGAWSTEVVIATAGCGDHGLYLPGPDRCICEDGYLGRSCQVLSVFTARNEAPPCFENHLYCLDFAVQDDTLYARMQGNIFDDGVVAQGWLALGFGVGSDGMSGGEMYLFTFPGNQQYKPQLLVLRATDINTPSIPLPNVVGDRVDGLFNSTSYDIRFERPLDPAVAGLFAIPAVAGQFVSVAWAASPKWFDGHPQPWAGRLEVDFVAGLVEDLSSNSGYTFYAPIAVAAGVILIAAAMMHLSPALARSSLGVCCLRKRPSTWLLSPVEKEAPLPGSTDSGALPGEAVPASRSGAGGKTERWLRVLDLLTFDIRPTLWDWTFGDYFLFLTYIVGLLLSVLVGYLAYDSENSARRHYVFGHLLALQFALTFLPVNRGSLWLRLLGVPYERAVSWHRVMARICVALLVIHVISMTNQWGAAIITAMDNTPEGKGVGWGSLAFLCIVLMAVLSWEPVRRRCFELFYFTHLCLFPLAVFFACMHNVLVRYYLIIALGIMFLDRIVGRVRSWTSCQIVSVRVLQGAGAASAYGAEAPGVPRLIRLEVTKPSAGPLGVGGEFSYKAGDYAFLSIPSLSWLAWHPFSITSNPATSASSQTITFHIVDAAGPKGGFTHELTHRFADAAASHLVGASTKPPSDFVVKIDGPYGNLSVPAREYGTVALVAGGIGITPLYSLLQALLSDQGTSASCVRSIHLIWVSRAPAAFTEWFPELLTEWFPRFQGVLKLHFFYTGAGVIAGSAPVKDIVQGRVTGASTSRRNTVAAPSGGVRLSTAQNRRGGAEPLPMLDDGEIMAAPARGKGVSLAGPKPPSREDSPGPSAAAASSAAPRASVAAVEQGVEMELMSSVKTQPSPGGMLASPSNPGAAASPFEMVPPPPPPADDDCGFDDADRVSDEDLPPPPPPAPLPPSVPAPASERVGLTSNPAVDEELMHDELGSVSPVGVAVDDGESGTRIHIHTGRPPLGTLFAQIEQQHRRAQEDVAVKAQGEGAGGAAALPLQSSVAVFVCGPRELIDDAQDHAMRRSWHLHKETFLL